MAPQELASLHVDTEVGWGGGQQQVLYLLEGLRRRGLRAELAARPRSVVGKRAAAAGASVHELPLRGEWDLTSALRIAGMLRRGRFGILHLHTAHAHALGRIASIVRRPPAVVVSRRVVFPIRGTVRRWFKYLRGVDKYIAVSSGVAGCLARAGVREERIAIVPSGVDPARFQNAPRADLRSELGLPPDVQLVGMVGQLTCGKGQEDLVSAAPAVVQKHPDTVFLLVGEGENRRTLEKLAAELGIADRVVLTGFRSDVPSVLAGLDVFVMPSHAEGFCNSVIEAMMAGLPVVGTNISGIASIVEDRRTGLLVPKGNAVGLAEAICKLLTDKDLRKEMGEKGRRRALDNFTVDNMVQKTIQIYEELGRVGHEE